jgi:hypothetical protein
MAQHFNEAGSDESHGRQNHSHSRTKDIERDMKQPFTLPLLCSTLALAQQKTAPWEFLALPVSNNCTPEGQAINFSRSH